MNFKPNPNVDVNGTSFHRTTIRTSAMSLIVAFGEAHDEDIDGKINWEWTFEREDGKVFTLYDWKRGPIGVETIIDFHIGSHLDHEDELLFVSWLEEQL